MLLRRLLFIPIFLLAACGGASTPTPTPVAIVPPTVVPTATPTPLPTATATATATATPTQTPSPTASPSPEPTETPTPTPLPTETPTPIPATETPLPEPTATEAASQLRSVTFDADAVQQTVVDIAAAQGIPLGNAVLTLDDGFITIDSTQLLFGSEIKTVIKLTIFAEAGEPVVDIVEASLAGQPLAEDAIADFERAITDGFQTGVRKDLAYESIEEITIDDGLMTVLFR